MTIELSNEDRSQAMASIERWFKENRPGDNDRPIGNVTPGRTSGRDRAPRSIIWWAMRPPMMPVTPASQTDWVMGFSCVSKGSSLRHRRPHWIQ